MFSNTGALVDTETDVSPEPEKELTILSCGHYRLLRLEKLHTVRIQGRRDWQLLYVAKARATFPPAEERVKQGSVVVYPPGEPQDYFLSAEGGPGDLLDTLYRGKGGRPFGGVGAFSWTFLLCGGTGPLFEVL